ncbi:InlB B-repeat-containing protein [Candidatus Saccharibacteria bacterium]|nr:InlB B-repeat-containing protein [Candidatus Saccharibacteria bacterium]
MRTKQKIMKKTLTLGIVLLVVSLVSFTCITFFGSNTSAETFESEQGISFTFNPAVKITITGGTGATSDGLTIDNLTPGDYKDSNIITVTAGSNSPLGYTLSSTVGSSTYNSTELRRGGTETANKFTNLSSNKASLSAFDPGYWGYSYSTDSGSTWISGDIVSGTSAGYNGLPIYTTASPIKLINSSTASSSSVQFKIGARATSSQTSGTYSNVVNFIGISKIVTTNYTINYNANAGSDTVTNMPTPNPLQGTDTTGNAAIKISSNVPVRTGYMFKGWCTSQTSDDTCSSDVVQPGGYVALNPGTSSATATVTKNLYAMWKSNSPAPPLPELCTDAATCMQTMTTCPTTPTTVTDGRDGKTYNVQQLNDGNCWMLDNLRLDLVDSTVQGNLTSDTTNAEDSSLAYLKGTASYRDPTSDPNGKYPTAALGYGDSSNYYSVPKISVSGTCYNAYCVDSPASGQWNSEVVTPQTINGVTSIAQGKVGIYYNYCAISAGTYCYGNGTSSTGSPSSDPKSSSLYDIDGDICPKGWRLPTSTADGEFQALYTAYNSNYTAFQTALDTPLSGYFNLGTARYQGSDGSFWSSTWYDTDYMRRLRVSSSGVSPSGNSSRYYGDSARCVLGS